MSVRCRAISFLRRAAALWNNIMMRSNTRYAYQRGTLLLSWRVSVLWELSWEHILSEIRRLTKTLSILVPLVTAVASQAAVVNLDLLGGIGDFDYSACTAWNSGYTGADYDFSTNSGWVSEPDAAGWRYGYNSASSSDAVAVGWMRQSGSTVNPGKHIGCWIADSQGLGGTNCQAFSLKGYYGAAGTVLLSTHIPTGTSPSGLQIGDSVTFRLDYVRMADYADLPAGTTVTFKMGLKWPGYSVEKVLDPSSSPFSAELTGGPLPTGVKAVTAYVSIGGAGPLDARQPTLFLDGARLWVRRPGVSGYVQEVVPVIGNRGIQSLKPFYGRGGLDVRDVTQRYDRVMLQTEEDYVLVPRLKYYNPNVKVYLYQSSRVIDRRDSRGVDPFFSSSPIGFGFVTSTYPGWLYSNGIGGYASNVAYPNEYYARVADASYQSTWAQNAITRARRARFDGIWLDQVTAGPEIRSGSTLVQPKQEAWEMQKFLHAVIPTLRSNGLDVIQNACTKHPQSGDGQVYLDPFWLPTDPYNPPAYAANTPSKTPNSLCQEWAFFITDEANSMRNRYDKLYWRQCLDDMDAIKSWNTAVGDRALSDADKKWLHMLVIGTDAPEDPAYGADGWLYFGLTSYLLAQNDWTTFGCGVRPTYSAEIDLSVTNRLGAPSGDHLPYNGDQYCRYRTYSATADGGVGGVVVVNANPDASREYTLEFDAVDAWGTRFASGSRITLPPHTGRILLRSNSNIRLTISAPTQDVMPGQVVSVVVTYTNTGSADADDAVVRAEVPPELTYVSGSGEGSGGRYDPVSNSVTWLVGTVPAGQGGVRIFQAKVN